MNKSKIITTAKQVIKTEITALKKLSNSLNESFVESINLLSKLKGRVICCGVGKSAKILEKISSTLSSIGISSFVLDPTDAGHGSLGAIKKNDILIIASFSGNSSELNNILKFSKKFSIKIIGISSNPKSNLIKLSDIKIIMPKVSEAGHKDLNMIPTSSSINLLSLGDAIAITMAIKNKFSKKDFGILHPSGSLGKNLSRVSEIMIKGKEIPTVLATSEMSNVVFKISSGRLGCVVVLNKEKKIQGFISDGDISRAIKKFKNFLSKKAFEIMTKKPRNIKKDCLIVDALKIMNQKKITALLVTNKKKQVEGIVHMHSLLSYLG